MKDNRFTKCPSVITWRRLSGTTTRRLTKACKMENNCSTVELRNFFEHFLYSLISCNIINPPEMEKRKKNNKFTIPLENNKKNHSQSLPDILYSNLKTWSVIKRWKRIPNSLRTSIKFFPSRFCSSRAIWLSSDRTTRLQIYENKKKLLIFCSMSISVTCEHSVMNRSLSGLNSGRFCSFKTFRIKLMMQTKALGKKKKISMKTSEYFLFCFLTYRYRY